MNSDIKYLFEAVNTKLSLAKIGRGTGKSRELIDSAVEDLIVLREKVEKKENLK